jgi:transcriptional regulator of arginine metabolism
MKIKRQSKIVELIKNNDIETQDMLVEYLIRDGFNVTQATVSRDIRELKLTKISTPEGKQKYAVLTPEEIKVSDRLKRVFGDGVISIDHSHNIIVIKTLTGMAMAVAAALDSMENTDIMGTIAGDDTIFCAVKSDQKTVRIVEKLKYALADSQREIGK